MPADMGPLWENIFRCGTLGHDTRKFQHLVEGSGWMNATYLQTFILPSILEYEASQLSKLSKDNSQITSQYTIKEPRNLNKECELKFETIIYHLRLFHGYCFYLILAKLCLKVRNSKVQSRRRHKNLITETEH